MSWITKECSLRQLSPCLTRRVVGQAQSWHDCSRSKASKDNRCQQICWDWWSMPSVIGKRWSVHFYSFPERWDLGGRPFWDSFQQLYPTVRQCGTGWSCYIGIQKRCGIQIPLSAPWPAAAKSVSGAVTAGMVAVPCSDGSSNITANGQLSLISRLVGGPYNILRLRFFSNCRSLSLTDEDDWIMESFFGIIESWNQWINWASICLTHRTRSGYVLKLVPMFAQVQAYDWLDNEPRRGWLNNFTSAR